ncbi:hypothetical protein F0231_17940 [Vibrio sp. RE86]|nr:hypothetical protein [Vibrio sp. RE86]
MTTFIEMIRLYWNRINYIVFRQLERHSSLILGFVGKTHAHKICRAFDLTSFGAFLSYEVPTVKVLDINELQCPLN